MLLYKTYWMYWVVVFHNSSTGVGSFVFCRPPSTGLKQEMQLKIKLFSKMKTFSSNILTKGWSAYSYSNITMVLYGNKNAFQWDASAQGVSARGVLPGGGVWPGGCLPGGCLPPPGTRGRQPPPPRWQRDNCKNITFANFVLRAIIMIACEKNLYIDRQTL